MATNMMRRVLKNATTGQDEEWYRVKEDADLHTGLFDWPQGMAGISAGLPEKG
jgi:hypothetical protein